MDNKTIDTVLMVLQLALFLVSRLLDDLSWHDVGVHDETKVFESVAIVGLTLCMGILLYRKRNIDGIWWILFLRSQIAFFIPYALQITIVILFFTIFGCHHQTPEGETAEFLLNYQDCCLNATQFMLSVVNFSLICNTKADRLEFFTYQFILFGEIIYDGHLLLYFVNHLEGSSKEYSILLLSIIIANQTLIMDLIFRAAYEDHQRLQAKEQEFVGHYRKSFSRDTRQLSKNIELTSTLRTQQTS